MDKAWVTLSIDRKDKDQIQPEEGKIGQILLGQRFPLKVSVNEPKTSQPRDSCSISREVRDRNSFLISYDHRFNGTSSAYQDPDLTPNFI